MQSAAMQAFKVQAAGLATNATKAASVAASRGPVQSLRPSAAPFVKPISTRGCALAAVTEAASPSSPSSSAPHTERHSAPGSPRRSINDLPFQVKFIIPNVLTGPIMGNGGEHINAIRDATGAFIQASRSGSAVLSPKDRMITIAGASVTDVKAAARMLLTHLHKLGVASRLERAGYAPGRLFLKQVIPAPCAGKVLGPGGDQIQTINMSSGAMVAVEAKPANAAFLAFRYINYMAPTIEKLADAMDMVTNLLAEDERYSPGIKDISSVAFKVVQIPEKRAGALLGPGGTYIKTLQDVIKVKMGIANGTTSGVKYVTVWGSPQNVNVAIDVISVATGGAPRGYAAQAEEDYELSDYAHEEDYAEEEEEEEGGSFHDGSGNGSGERR